ncbi:MAG: helix-turn-helix domain-containing protein [Microthrixaceae bacterium]
MLQLQARALGDPTRYEIFRRIAGSRDSFDIPTLTEEFGLNHNAIRQHLAKLVDAGLVIEYTASSRGRGRPRLLYRLSPSADSRWGLIGPYERLAMLLTQVLRSGDTPLEVGREAGRQEMTALQAVSESAGPLEVLLGAMASQGFDPDLEVDGAVVEAHLLECPFASAARADPEIVCSIHMGMVEGMVEGIEGFEMDSFEQADPMSGQCCVHGHLVGTSTSAQIASPARSKAEKKEG